MNNPPYVIVEPERLSQFGLPKYGRCAAQEILYQLGVSPTIEEDGRIVTNYPVFRAVFGKESCGYLICANDHRETNAERIAAFRAWCERQPNILYVPLSQRPDSDASLPHGVDLPSSPEPTKGIPVHGPVGSTEMVGV